MTVVVQNSSATAEECRLCEAADCKDRQAPFDPLALETAEINADFIASEAAKVRAKTATG
jgi:hypothetical protein